MTIAELGEEGLAAMVEHQLEMGEYLLQRLKAKGWAIVNHSPLPVICFTPPESRYSAEEVLNRIIQHGKCWISKVCLGV